MSTESNSEETAGDCDTHKTCLEWAVICKRR